MKTLSIKKHPILILDFGSQYTQLIARRIREMGVYCEIHHYDIAEHEFAVLAPCGVIFSGGPQSTTEQSNARFPTWLIDKQVPVLGICYGMQIMAQQLGGAVQNSTVREFGYAALS